MSSCIGKCLGLNGRKQSRIDDTVMDALMKAIKDQLDPKYHAPLEKMEQNAKANADTRSVFFVGAGASVESGLPNFRQFSEHMLNQLISQNYGVPAKDISMFVSELRPEVLLQALHEVYGGGIFEFYDWFEGAEPSTNHFILARVLKEGGLVLTTNIDVLIEKAYQQLYGSIGDEDRDGTGDEGLNSIDVNLLVTKEDFEQFSIEKMLEKDNSRGTLMKFHGTVDTSKIGLDKYDTVRFLLDQVGKGIDTGMHEVLMNVCNNFDMVYLGYSGCDNFSVQPVLCHSKSERTTLWLWYEWREQMELEDSSTDAYERDMNEIGTLVSEGKSFSEISRGMETLSTCEILSERENALRLRGKVSDIMNATALPDHDVFIAGACVDPCGPIPDWTKVISAIDRVRGAAKLYSRASCTDEAIKFLEEANRLASGDGEDGGNATTTPFVKAQVLKELGNEYEKASTSESYAKALSCYNDAFTIFESSSHSTKAAETRLDTINVLRRTRRFDEAEDLLEALELNGTSNDHNSGDADAAIQKVSIRRGLMKGLILGMGRRDTESREKALSILEEAAKNADEGGFVGLHAAILNASGLIKYQMAGNSIDLLESGAKDLDIAFRLNIYIGDARSCFQQMRNVGLIHAKLSRLTDSPELLEQAITEFKRGEKFLFRLSKNRIMGELLEIRFRLGESLVAAGRLDEAEPILSKVREERVKQGDWHNEARTLELLVKCAYGMKVKGNGGVELSKRANQIKFIYEDALTNESKQERFVKVPITASNGRQIIQTASDAVKDEDNNLSIELQSISERLFNKN
mmetsp:Transcript_1755/g.2318  ORF Transcript_1755/g.2318 Transcript_1755/m.2318 type:complete len:804 (+) Transcript_1755:133-2544(+)